MSQVGPGGVLHPARFDGAAADFIGGLGRKVGELRVAIDALASTPELHRSSEELRRKLHALGLGARLLRFDALARAITDATSRIDDEWSDRRVSDPLLDDLTILLTRVLDLALAAPESSLTPPPRSVERAPIRARPTTPWTVVVIGREDLAAGLRSTSEDFPCEAERSDDIHHALALARAVAPDALVVDLTLPGVQELLESVLGDALLGPVPVVGVGDVTDTEAARWAAQGVARVVSPSAGGAGVRRACAEIVGRSDAPVGMGGMGAMEGVTGVFKGDGAAAPLSPSGANEVGAETSLSRPDAERRSQRVTPSLEVDLEGRTIVVADDDPSVVSFIGGVMRAAGATVLGARDGQEALTITRNAGPDAVLSDVLMPVVDGLTVARTLRRDVALRDRPIILLSWRDDLLKRLRDFRMESHAMLRKEADAATMLARVREVLAPRVRVEARIARGGEVRGRLDGLTMTSLLEITNRVRHDASIVVRDAANLFELELEGGGVRGASCTGVDGSFLRGPAVLPNLLGVVGGRFLVRPLQPHRPRPHAESFDGELQDQLAPLLRRLRAACDAVSGVGTLDLAFIELDRSQLEAYLQATPPAVRSLLERLARGESPRDMVLAGRIAPAVLEDILLDLAARGLVSRATGTMGEDLLLEAEQALEAPHPLVGGHGGVGHGRAPSPSGPSSRGGDTTSEYEEIDLESSPVPGSFQDAVLQMSDPRAGDSRRRPAAHSIIDTRALKPRSSPTRSDPVTAAAETLSATPTPPSAAHAPVPSRPAESRTLHGAAPPPAAETLHGVPGPPMITASIGVRPPVPPIVAPTVPSLGEVGEVRPRPRTGAPPPPPQRANRGDKTPPPGPRPTARPRLEIVPDDPAEWEDEPRARAERRSERSIPAPSARPPQAIRTVEVVGIAGDDDVGRTAALQRASAARGAEMEARRASMRPAAGVAVGSGSWWIVAIVVAIAAAAAYLWRSGHADVPTPPSHRGDTAPPTMPAGRRP